MKAISYKLRPLRPLRAGEAETAASETTASSSAGGSAATASSKSSSSNNGQLMPMADSLIERAKEVATTGTVDDAFKESFVSELEAELGVLAERAQQAEAQAAALEETLKSTRDQFLRLNADFDNFRKRTAAEKERLRNDVKGDTVMQLVPLIDNFEAAKKALKLESEGEKRVDAAYQGLYKQMVTIFRDLGVEAVAGVGSPFDPNVHEAIMREPNDDVADGTVLEEFRKGFRLGDQLLRPAMVKVSFSDKPSAASESGSASESNSESE